MDNFTINPNGTLMNLSWEFNSNSDDAELYNKIANIFVPILMGSALIAMLVNMIVFTSVYWIRRPLTPILKVSLSLAAADALSSSIFAATLFIGDYLPVIGIDVKWLQVIMEMIKLSGILITVTHLLALSLNHYIGILKPLHYNSIVTRRKVCAVIVILWVGPTLFIIALFALQADAQYWQENFQNLPVTDPLRKTFLDTFRFRMAYSAFFFITIILMAFCYMHILLIVRKQQNTWKNLSRIGSTKWRGKTSKNCNISKTNKEKKQLEGNIRAIHTTLLILGSCILGWMPALLLFVLMCREDCYINGKELEYITEKYLLQAMCLRLVENMLVILKMLANPIIYSIRMKEIQESTKHLYSAVVGIFCTSRITNTSDYILASRRSLKKRNYSMQRLAVSINNSAHNSHSNIGHTEILHTSL